MIEDTELISLTKAAKEIGVTTGTLRRAARNGELKAQKVGERAWVVTRKAVQEWQATPEYHRPGPKSKG